LTTKQVHNIAQRNDIDPNAKYRALNSMDDELRAINNMNDDNFVKIMFHANYKGIQSVM
jgi:hypothetical protein